MLSNAYQGGRVDAPVARYIGPRNSEAVTGHLWRWCRDHAREWKVPILRIDAKPLIPADAFFRALEAHATVEVVTSEPSELDEIAAFRARVARAG